MQVKIVPMEMEEGFCDAPLRYAHAYGSKEGYSFPSYPALTLTAASSASGTYWANLWSRLAALASSPARQVVGSTRPTSRFQ